MQAEDLEEDLALVRLWKSTELLWCVAVSSMCASARHRKTDFWHKELASVSSSSRHNLLVSSRVLITQCLH